MIVVDASVLVNAFTDDGPVGERGRHELARDPQWAAPEHIIVEVFAAIRGRWLGGKINEQRAVAGLTAMTEVTIDRQVSDGTRVTVTVNGTPVAEIGPVRSVRRQFFSKSELIEVVSRSQADPGLTDDLSMLAGDTTDDLDSL